MSTGPDSPSLSILPHSHMSRLPFPLFLDGNETGPAVD